MGSRHISRWKTASWCMRGCYVLTLGLVAAICMKFYAEQGEQNHRIVDVQALTSQFGKVSVAMRVLADKADQIAVETPEKLSNPRVEALLRSKTIEQRRQILSNQPMDQAIIPFKKALLFYQNKARVEVETLHKIWNGLDGHLITVVLDRSRYMKLDDPFKDHYSMLSPRKIEEAKTTADIHWVAREIFSAFDNIVTVSNLQAVESLHNYGNIQAGAQGVLLERFLLITLGALVILGLAVFLPLDIFIQKMMRRIVEKTGQAERGRSRLEILANINADWIWEMDENLRFSYFSEPFEEVTHVKPEMLLGKTRRETGIPGLKPEELEAHLKLLEDREPFVDVTHSRKNRSGNDIWLSVSGNPIFDEANQFKGYLGVGRDVTENIQRQFELEEARAKAQSADRAKSEFLANMSHEIRTPMNGVMGMAELLARTELNEKQKTFADIIVKSGASLLTIINDILDFSKIDAGQMELDPVPFVLVEAIEDVATLVSSKIAEKDLELSVRIAPDLPEMYEGDVGRLRQIVTNLLGNAVKFTEQGHIFIDVDGKKDESGNTKLHFRIEDTGIGIAPETCDRIFEKFSQVDNSATRKHEGTGLGLTISYSLVKLMGGEIGVQSKQGEGSTFWFDVSLPIHGEEMPKNATPQKMSGARILIVDDNEVNRSILSEQMATWNFDSAAAASGKEALSVLKAAAEQGITPDAVVLDYHMPDMTGSDVAAAIRADSKTRDVPIVMLTSVDQMEDGRMFSSLGIQGHLIKPARSALLLETIVRVLQEKRPHGEHLNPGIAMAKSIGAANPSKDSQKIHAVEVAGKPAVEQVVDEGNDDTIEVLLVEDNEVNQLLFTQILISTEISFMIANDGEEALELYTRHKPKVICMDVSLPGMDGFEVTQEIRRREHDSGKRTPVIGVTAHAIEGDKERCLESGMDDYLPKPVSPDMLEEKINFWLKRDSAITKVA